MTELLLEIQRSKKLGDPTYLTECTSDGFFSYVIIPIDLNGKTVEFKSNKKDHLFDATENVARKAVDSVTATYKFNIVDYTYPTLEKMSRKWAEIELTNTHLEESNRVLLKSLSEVQEANRQHREEIALLKMQCKNYVASRVGNISKTRKIKEERDEIGERVERKKSKISKKLMF